MSAPTPLTIQAGFPYQTLSVVAVLPGAPTYESLRLLQRELNANASSVSTLRGDGLSGHLVLTCPTAVFTALAGDLEFDVPVHPGQAPVLTGLDAAASNAAQYVHANALRDFQVYNLTSNALKAQLLQACPSIYLRALEHAHFGLTRVTPLEILTHLMTTYGQITPADALANGAALHTPFWNPPEPIETLFQTLQDRLDYAAAANAPISDATATQAAYNNLEATGLFRTYCETWRATPTQTFAACATFFKKADLDRQRVTAGAHGYTSNHLANAAISRDENAVLRFELMEVREALAHANAVKTATNEQRLEAENQQLRAQLKQRPVGATPGNTKGYCYTHGTTKDPSHTSATCLHRAPGHQEKATFRNKMGGK